MKRLRWSRVVASVMGFSLLLVGCGSTKSTVGSESPAAVDAKVSTELVALYDANKPAPLPAVDLHELISTDVAEQLTTVFLSRYGKTADVVTVVPIDMDAASAIIGDPISSKGTGAVAFVVGDLIDAAAKSPAGEVVAGKTAFVLLLPDGSILGGGLFVDDLSGDFAKDVSVKLPLSLLRKP